MLGAADGRCGATARGSRRMGGSAERGGESDRLALYDGGCTHQAQASLPDHPMRYTPRVRVPEHESMPPKYPLLAVKSGLRPCPFLEAGVLYVHYGAVARFIRVCGFTRIKAGSSMENKVNIFFSEFFDVLPALVEGYGAVVVSLIGDLPLFIDPFLLFNSDNPIYQQLQTTLSSI